MKQYKGIIFDLDGTLLDTIEDLGRSVNCVLAHYQLPEYPMAAYKKMVGNGMQNLLLSSIPEGQSERIDFEQAFEMFRTIYSRQYMTATKPYEGIPELVSWLVDRGIQLGVNSNKRDDYSQALIKKYFAGVPFVRVYGEQDRFARKPDPSAALDIASAMGEQPEHILYIGDSEVDIMTGKNAGMDTVAVLWGFRSQPELEANQPVYFAAKPKNIRDLFESSM